MRATAGHSAEHFGHTRDHWWNLDFLRLMAERWRLGAVRDVLDVGCGIGHWGMLLAGILPDRTRFTGVDRETMWIERATARAAQNGLGERFTYLEGAAERLPFPDGTFDFTTCQTVLIHVPDPGTVIAEMRRVTKPGGLVAVAEPNNVTESLLLDSISNRLEIHEIVELVRFQLTCERGKIALGEGDNSLGDRVPGLFVEHGLVDVEVYVNDKATAIFPPYTRADQRAYTEDARDRAAAGIWNWNDTEARRLFLAGGGAEAQFEAHFARALESRRRIVRGLEDGTYHGVIGGPFYLVSGRTPR
jgi:SAM-dependent methyltransferase